MKKLLLLITVLAIFLASCSSPAVVKEDSVKNDEPLQVVENAKEEVLDTAVEVEKVVSEPVVYKNANEDVQDPYIDEDGINWSTRTIKATGIGAPNPKAPNMAVKRAGAINAAKIVALRDLLGTLKGMYVSSEQTAENYMMTSDIVKTKVEGIAKAYRVVGEPNYFDDGSVEITVEMSINGDLADVFIGDSEYGDTTPLVGEATYKLSDLVGTPEAQAYTGIIIDCKDIKLRPALAPKVYNKSGTEVYGSAKVNKDFAVQQGMIGYLKSLDSAKENARVTNNPLVIKAIGVKGKNKADIIISDEDAVKIKELDQKLNFLKECRVIALIH